MRFGVSKQLVVLASSLVVLSVLLSSWLAYENSKSDLEKSIGAELLALVNSTSVLIDAEMHSEIVRVDEDFIDGMDSFEQIRNLLLQIKQVNRLEVNAHGSPIYTLRKSFGFNKHRKLEFVVMTDPNENNEFFVGHQLPAEEHHMTALQGQSTTTRLYKDAYGLWISAVAPILNREGEVLGLVQADRHVDFFYREAAAIAKELMAGAAIVIAIAIVIGFYYSRRITQPIKQVVDAAQAFGKGDYDQAVDINRDDEFGFLGRTFNKMAVRIKESQAAQLQQSQDLQKLSAELVQANRGLEAKVAERTREVRKNHAELEVALKSLKQSQANLVQSEKMASLGQLAAGVAHEINNPIAFISSNLETLKTYAASIIATLDKVRPIIDANQSGDKEAMDKAVQGYMDTYEKEDIDFLFKDINMLLKESIYGVSRVSDIVSDLKGYSRSDENDYKDANINDCLETTLKMTQNKTRYKCEIIKEYGELPRITCNPGKLSQVFTNLIVNAVQAIEKDGLIKIATYVEGDYVVAEVTDNGVGISEENLEKMFDAFFTTKPVGTGTGLGLYISYSIIQEHQGQLFATSEVGKGTVFTTKLPISKALESVDAA